MRACIVGLRRGAQIMHRHLRLFRGYIALVSLGSFLRVNWIPTSFSLVFMVVRAERMVVYIVAAFPFV